MLRLNSVGVVLLRCGLCVVFFFKQKTAYEIGTGDWSSDVCSSDLGGVSVTTQYRCLQLVS